jgi:hypothetical protein
LRLDPEGIIGHEPLGQLEGEERGREKVGTRAVSYRARGQKS